MNNFPLISAIIPVYNREKYIKQALDSVLDEDYPNKEIVVINDGSTDNTDSVIKAWIEEHKDKISVIYKSRENRGITGTLNELIDLSNGEYIVFFGSDDYLKNNGIRKRYEYLRIHPDKLMVIADCNLVDSYDNLIYKSALESFGKVNKKLLFTNDGMKKFMILNGFTPGATLMADKKIYKLLGKYDETFHTEDWVYLIKVTARNMLGYIDEIVSAYRIHDSNACFSDSIIIITMEQFKVTLDCFKDFKEFKYKYYLILKLIYLSIFIQYISLKLKLIHSKEKYKNDKFREFFIKTILEIQIELKNIFNSITYSIFKN